MGKQLTPVWGIDDEGELRSCWKEIGLENMWLMMGASPVPDPVVAVSDKCSRQLCLVPLLL